MTRRRRATLDPAGDVVLKPLLEATDYAEDDSLWRAYGVPTDREPTPEDHRAQLAASDDAWRHHPLAYRAIELTVDYILGRGMTLRAKSERCQVTLDRWWNHPANNWPLRQFDLVRELCLTGEVFMTFHTAPGSRMTLVRIVPSSLISEIETDPDDIERELRYRQANPATLTGKGYSPLEGRWWNHDAGLDATAPIMRHYAINRLAGTTRGQGDLVTILPWLIRYKDWLTDRVRLNKHQQAFIFDVTLEGADRRTLIARRNEIAVAPDPGSIIVHNEKEKWDTVKPALNASAAADDGMAIRLMIAAGSGFPLHFMGEAENANLATATAMEGPALRRLERRQLQVAAILSDIATECMRRANHDDKVRAEYAYLRTDDTSQIATATKTIAEALVIAREAGWVTDKEARDLFTRFLGEQASGQTLASDDPSAPKPESPQATAPAPTPTVPPC